MIFTFGPEDLEILEGIIEEATEHLSGIEEGILKMEVDFGPVLVDSVFRALHSIKGVSGFLNLTPIKDTAHVLESILNDMRKGLYVPNAEITDLLLQGIDILNHLVSQLEQRLQEMDDGLSDTKFEFEIDDGGFSIFVTETEKKREQMCSQGVLGGPPRSSAPTKDNSPIRLSFLLEQSLPDFLEEMEEHLNIIEQSCVTLERGSDDEELLNAILRGFHSIKGGAGVIASIKDEDNPRDPVQVIGSVAHAAETLLQACRKALRRPSSEIIDVLFLSVDRLKILAGLVQEGREVDFAVEELILRMEGLAADIDEKPSADQGGSSLFAPGTTRQLAAFINITEQALESMQGIIKGISQNRPLGHKKYKQYWRALGSLGSATRYLNYDEMQQLVEEQIELLKTMEESEPIDREFVEQLETGYDRLQRLLEVRIAELRDSLEQVLPEYADKKLGEILLAKNKITPEVLDEALRKQRKLGEILVESGAVKPAEVDMALSQQERAQTLTRSRLETARISSEATGQSIRVSQEKLDRLMNMIGELLISKNHILHLASRIGQEYQLPALAREVKSTATDLARISDELQDAIMSARMVPLRVLFQRYPRTIRDIAKRVGKKVDLIIEGDETELDKSVIEAINDPLVHMLRNAVDHGIEMPEVRQSKGKDINGTIGIKAYYQGHHAVIEIGDDGCGMEPEAIKMKALQKGLISLEQAETMTVKEAFQLIFAPGFSTREEVTELSGRGVGMDVVKSNIERIGGTVELSSVAQAGTTIIVRIPLSMSIIKGLIVECAGEQYIIALDVIDETVKLPGEGIRRYKKNLVADIRGGIVPLFFLQEALKLEDCKIQEINGQYLTEDRVSVVVIDSGVMRFGLIVDRFQKEQEFVIKALAEELAGLKIFSGATILGDGSVVLILNPLQLIQVCLSDGLGGN